MGLFSDRGGIDRRGGRLVNVTVVPELARGVNQSPGGEEAALHAGIHAMESLSNVLINAAAFGQYSLAGLVLPPAVFATPGVVFAGPLKGMRRCTEPLPFTFEDTSPARENHERRGRK